MTESGYKELVLADYDEKRDAGLLPSELLSPTPGRIKSEAVKVCYSRFNPKDEIILTSFVEKKDGMAGYRAAFQTCDADIFRQLVKLIKNRSINPDVIYINFLAWLIDFHPRPFHPELKMPVNKVKATIIPTAEEGNSLSQPEPKQPIQPKKSSKKPVFFAAAILILAVLGALLFQAWRKHYTGHEACMIWNDDHYEPIECNDQSSTAPHYPIDHKLVDHFRRIKRQDTLTYRSIRKVWYSNYKGRMEFYTDSGANPLDTNFRVLPMTTHILEKYVLHITN